MSTAKATLVAMRLPRSCYVSSTASTAASRARCSTDRARGVTSIASSHHVLLRRQRRRARVGGDLVVGSLITPTRCNNGVLLGRGIGAGGSLSMAAVGGGRRMASLSLRSCRPREYGTLCGMGPPTSEPWCASRQSSHSTALQGPSLLPVRIQRQSLLPLASSSSSSSLVYATHRVLTVRRRRMYHGSSSSLSALAASSEEDSNDDVIRRLVDLPFFSRHSPSSVASVADLLAPPCPSDYIDDNDNKSDVNDEKDSKQSSTRTILACSPATTTAMSFDDGDDSRRQRFSSIVRLTRHSWSYVASKVINTSQYVWRIACVSVRGAEIALRLSPLIILAPVTFVASRRRSSSDDSNQNIESSDDIDNVATKEVSTMKKGAQTTAAAQLLSDLTWSYTLHSLQKLGPAFVKLAQWAATRRDLFPPSMCDRLSTLHDAVDVHSWDYTHQTLVASFGEDYEEWLMVDKDEILGSGSAAQVYRGTLLIDNDDTEEGSRRTTKDVAIKVLHPNIHSAVERDLLLMERVASLLDALPFDTIRTIGLPGAASTFASVLRRQTDLRVEGNNLSQFRRNFDVVDGSGDSDGMDFDDYGTAEDNYAANAMSSSSAASTVSFPRPINQWISRDVLIEEYVSNATPISSFLHDESPQGIATRRALAGPLLRAFLKMVFTDNFVHCDLHPGNVLVQTSSSSSANIASRGEEERTLMTNTNTTATGNKHTIVFLDAGIVESLSPNERRNLRDLFRAVILNDGYTAGTLMVERAKHERCSTIDGGLEAFASGVQEIVAEFHDSRKKGLTLGAVRIGSLLGRVLDLCRIHGVEVDPAMASIVVSTLVLEGLGRSLEPDLNLIDCALPFVTGRGSVV